MGDSADEDPEQEQSKDEHGDKPRAFAPFVRAGWLHVVLLGDGVSPGAWLA